MPAKIVALTINHIEKGAERCRSSLSRNSTNRAPAEGDLSIAGRRHH
ncbi:hypothetical protein [Ignatzschineria cameli]|nr:hypothetical protein [Ignatzschineria cameli]